MRSTRVRLIWTVLLGIGLMLIPLSTAGQQGKQAPAEKINLNTASSEQLQTLPGIGPALAERIIAYRTKVGKFTKIEELLNVSGIGEKRFQQFKDRLTV
jgi:competence protein ComEA